jgi:hypothetical protein
VPEKSAGETELVLLAISGRVEVAGLMNASTAEDLLREPGVGRHVGKDGRRNEAAVLLMRSPPSTSRPSCFPISMYS